MDVTKKIKRNTNKKTLWNLFDQEINKDTTKLECVYSKKTCREMCDICHCSVKLADDGFLICSNEKCGIIYKDILDLTAEWRYYGAEDSSGKDPTRCGIPINPLLKESSYGCKVVCEGNSSYEMRKIRRYTEWQSMPYREKSQYDEFQRITIMANNHGIPKMIIDEALKHHKSISEKKTFRGLNRDGIIAASIYISCKIHDYPRTAKEIAKIFNLDSGSATKGCKNAMNIINELEVNMENDDKTQFYNTKPISFIERYCSKLNISNEFTKLCQFVALQIENNNIIPENTPHSVAAGIIYFISQEFNLNITKKDINIISEISEVTINKCYKKMEKIKTILIPSLLYQKYSI
tara:strand:- start:1735 stop:2784 length:1050 start_codon:yes stop_codon:yes gene_type:complete